MIAGHRRQYFWHCCAFVVLVICVHAAGDSLNAFNVAVLRVQQTGMGILVYTLVSALLWPTTSRGLLDEVTCKLFATQASLFRNYRALLSGHGTAEESRPLRMQAVQLLSQRAQALNAAETDGCEVWEVRHEWRHFHQQSAALMEALEQWRESFAEIQPLDRNALLPNLEAVCTEIDWRLAEIERVLTGKPPARTPQAVKLTIDIVKLPLFYTPLYPYLGLLFSLLRRYYRPLVNHENENEFFKGEEYYEKKNDYFIECVEPGGLPGPADADACEGPGG
jgi:uncharacterized membrane protein YccC